MNQYLEILDWLQQLKANNNKAWFDAHRADYERHRTFWMGVVRDLIRNLAELDSSIGRLEPKDCIFRINRDIRFAADKSPYKTQFGAFIAPGGKQAGRAGYYIHLEPEDQCFIAGGIYLPEVTTLLRLRTFIDEHAEGLAGILNASGFRKYFSGLDADHKLRRAPKGFDPDHPYLDLLLHKSYTVSHPFRPESFPDAASVTREVIAVFDAMAPFIEYLNNAVSRS